MIFYKIISLVVFNIECLLLTIQILFSDVHFKILFQTKKKITPTFSHVICPL